MLSSLQMLVIGKFVISDVVLVDIGCNQHLSQPPDQSGRPCDNFPSVSSETKRLSRPRSRLTAGIPHSATDEQRELSRSPIGPTPFVFFGTSSRSFVRWPQIRELV